MSSGGIRANRLWVLPLLFALTPVAAALVLARSSGASVASPSPRTLVATRHAIWAFAQDGGRVAWIGRQSSERCGLHVRTIRTGRTATTPVSRSDCDRYSSATQLALAGRTAAWATGYSCGNNECFWNAVTTTAGDGPPRVVDREDLPCYPESCDSGAIQAKPLLAGAGRLLVYFNGQGSVERIRGGSARPLFRTDGAVYDLATGSGLIATASQSLVQGDGCGCLNAPSWSPDGSKIAYLRGSFDRYGGGTGALAVMNTDGSGRHDLPGTGSLVAERPSWSPDGAKIAYVATAPTLPYEDRVIVVNSDGPDSQTLQNGDYPSWSPDGSKIAFASNRGGGPVAISVMNPDGTDIQELASFAGSTWIGGITWSPDGTRIAFSLNGGLEVMNADGSAVHALGNNVAAVNPTWSPDGSQIVFNHVEGFNNHDGLWAIAADGSDLRQLTTGPDAYASWSPDGKMIVFASDRNDAYANAGIFDEQAYLELYIVDSDGSNLRSLSFTQPAAWLNTLAVRSSGGKPVAVATVPGPERRAPVIAGKSLALGDTVSGVDQITLFDVHTGAQLGVVQVGEGSARFELVGADANWIAYRSDNTISALNVHTHRVVRLAEVPAGTVFISVSGRRVAWVENFGPRRRPHGRIRAVELPS